MANLVTRILITARDEASSVFSSLQAKVAGVAAAIAGFFGVALFKSSVDSARDFESAMAAVQAAAGATAAELAELEAAAKEAGTTTQYSSVEAANALEELVKAGLSASDAVKALPAALDLATAGSVGLAEAAGYITQAVAGMGLSFEDAGRVADVLAQGANATKTSVEGLGQALSYAAPIANSLGLSLEETVGYLGKFADAGIDASRSGTALNAILAQFIDPASKFSEALRNSGIRTRDFNEAIRQMAAAGPRASEALLAVGTEAGPALRALLNQGIGALDDLVDKLEQSQGSARTFAEVMSSNLNGAFKGLGSAWEALKIELGQPVLDTLARQVAAVAERLRAFVSDGTAKQFGETIREAFESAGKWASDFFGRVDFSQLAADMRQYASDLQATLTDIGNRATTAGNILSLAWAAMGTGLATVKTAIYSLGAGMSWLASAFLADLAKITDGLAKITFGDLSQSFAAAAQSIKFEAQAAYAVMEEFGKKSEDAFDEAADSSVAAQKAWDDIGKPIAEANKKLEKAQEIVGMTAESLETLGNTAVVAGGKLVNLGGKIEEVGTKATASGAAQAAAAEAARAKVVELRAEYDRLIAAGDTQGAAKVFVEMQSELDKTKVKAEDTAEAVNAAFTRLGVKSTQEMNRVAESYRRDYEIIRDSGTASAADIAAAYDAYVKAAVSGSTNIVDSMRGVQGAAGSIAAELERAVRSASGQEIDALIDEINALSFAGKLSETEVRGLADAVAEVREKAEDAVPGIQSIGEAFRKLGVESPESLTRAAQVAEEAFDLILSGGREVKEQLPAAFEAYANAAIAANGGVADATIKAQAAQYGFKVETDETGKSIVRSMKEAKKATEGLAESTEGAADGMGDLAEATEDVADAQSSAASATDNLSNANVVATGTWMTAAGAASKYAAEAREAAWAIHQASRYTSDITASFAAYVAGMEALDRQQNAINSNGARGLEDLKLRWLELNGTEEEIAAARHRRDEADMQRQIALMNIEIKRAARRGEDVSVLKDEIALMKEQLVWLDKIFAEEEKQRKARAAEAEKEEKRRERERREAERNRNKPSDESDSDSSPRPTAPTTNAAPRDPARTVTVNLNIGGKTIPVTTTESNADALIRELESAQSRS